MALDELDVVDEGTEDTELETEDTSDQYDELLEGKTLDELYDLRDQIMDTGENNEAFDSDSLQKLEDLTETDDQPQDYSFHWDGGPTHDVDLDDDAEPTTYAKVLKR